MMKITPWKSFINSGSPLAALSKVNEHSVLHYPDPQEEAFKNLAGSGRHGGGGADSIG
jgi:hypothetical protein